MTDIIERIKDGPIKKWYRNNVNLNFLNTLVTESEEDGYILDPNSGLLIRKVYSDEIMKNLGYTIVDIIFPRPVDLHHHEDVDEALRVVGGSGILYTRIGNSVEEKSLSPKTEVYIPKRVSHSFRPYYYDYLKIRLACSGILNPTKEVCEERFDSFQPWIEYYKQQFKQSLLS